MSPHRLTPRSAREWGAVLPQFVGLAGLIFCALFWAVTYLTTGTGALEPALLTAFGTLIVVGQSAQAIADSRQPPPPPPSLRRESPTAPEPSQLELPEGEIGG